MDREFNIIEVKDGISKTIRSTQPSYFVTDKKRKARDYETVERIASVLNGDEYSNIERLKVLTIYHTYYSTVLPGYPRIFGVQEEIATGLAAEIRKLKELIEFDKIEASNTNNTKVANKGAAKVGTKTDGEPDENNYPRYFALKLILDELKIVDRDSSDEYEKVTRANIQRLHEFISGIPSNSLNTFIYHEGALSRKPKGQKLKLYLTKIRELFVPFQKNPNVHVDRIVDKIDQSIREIGSY